MNGLTDVTGRFAKALRPDKQLAGGSGAIPTPTQADKALLVFAAFDLLGLSFIPRLRRSSARQRITIWCAFG